MTSREKKMESMLNYFQIETGGTRDEKMTKKEKKEFLDKFNLNYETESVMDILSKLSDKFNNKEGGENEEDEPFNQFIDFNADDEPEFETDQNKDKKLDGSALNKYGFNPEIEKFIIWISNLLYSSDHIVVVTEDKDAGVTNIRLEKIKKKGGNRK